MGLSPRGGWGRFEGRFGRFGCGSAGASRRPRRPPEADYRAIALLGVTAHPLNLPWRCSYDTTSSAQVITAEGIRLVAPDDLLSHLWRRFQCPEGLVVSSSNGLAWRRRLVSVRRPTSTSPQSSTNSAFRRRECEPVCQTALRIEREVLKIEAARAALERAETYVTRERMNMQPGRRGGKRRA